MAKQLKLTWTKSFIGCPETQRATIKSLGFKKLQQSLIKEDCPQIRGQISKVQHLLMVEEL
ncbi:50S ribosomal protein L30 [Syntrophomonas wolfei]|uniref:Large ribosomal subunit protein uL30 n=1 Tax=Syntrophomonas wolfei subsp. wolfei (strain DSM 2245B / Goettingen) TaxID=335541 RepID=RL30_SYNWW|nr:50S ribosomal protein L30 [Syntrophomonas wolfei]Q0AUJ8.1 RecName: Full=Large ribosomal subunit protein uL30; AltName: Full=50S ribosomal protein L30 [Syntrophomonas wolfei subsp. wolfei str. Goettingen G311]ABI69606.1 LSU ribosomal protein L30P [Syntrophomonas wolfei subsp. wolfei str. Goettingen G311]